jgi:multiple sugar transport system substrate-binding protein
METVHENTQDTPRRGAVALCASSVQVLSACGGASFGGASKSQATGPAKLTSMIGSSGDAETNAVKAAAAAWSKQSGNNAQVIVASDLGQQLGQGFAGGTPPDLFYADASRIGNLAKVGNLYT